MFYSDDPIPGLEQILHSRDVNPGKMVCCGVDLGTQISPTLGILRSASASEGVTLRKVGREVVLVLQL
jgi:hypothetical protein